MKSYVLKYLKGVVDNFYTFPNSWKQLQLFNVFENDYLIS